MASRTKKLSAQIIKRQVYRTRKDIEDWQYAIRQAENVDYPNRSKLYAIYDMIALDAIVQSQMNNRKLAVLGKKFGFVNGKGKPVKELEYLKKKKWLRDIVGMALDSQYYGHSLVELTGDSLDNLIPEVVIHRHVVPERGEIKINDYDLRGIPYRDTSEYGKSLIEFGGNYELGLLNAAVPYVVMMRFVLSCWAEFTEVFGMPTMVVKTNTNDPAQYNKAVDMIRDLGSATKAVVDINEIVEFANAVTSNGEIYQNFIKECTQQLSLLLSGALLGQDTKFGTRGKEQVSQDLLSRLIESDCAMVESWMNDIVIPALRAKGLMGEDVFFEFTIEKDVDALFSKVEKLLPHFDFDPKYIKAEFGIEVLPKAKPDPATPPATPPAAPASQPDTPPFP